MPAERACAGGCRRAARHATRCGLAQAEEAEYRENDDYGSNKPDDIHDSSPCPKGPDAASTDALWRVGGRPGHMTLGPAIYPSLPVPPQHSCLG
ncbi:protein of unknown function (plasmid) [Cupriavidus taiwanensis]|uniref:Uncharacterized protein n=1 Tax=Cupriavidus taiwanensis TaxID=164546 RepID=A0A375ILM8_9BURK|nr:hypothetical protein CBM2629_B130006 [Cupriavidus taiwanensis]SPK74372.1 protein of unknown function [Cupriavidus taiwanensis]